MTVATPPKTRGALARREARLAWWLLLPTITIVSLVIILPLVAIFWISVKPVGLADLRPATPVVRESLRSRGDNFRIEYRVRNSSQEKSIKGVSFSDVIPAEITINELPEPCSVSGQKLVSVILVILKVDLASGYESRSRYRRDKDSVEDGR